MSSKVDPAIELEELRDRLATAEETLRAIRAGEVDAVVVEGPDEPQVYTLTTAVEPYRRLVEQMAQGALTVSREGLILFCNENFARLVGCEREQLFGAWLQEHIAPGAGAKLRELLDTGHEPGREIAMRNRDGNSIETYVSSSPLSADGDDLRCLIVTDLTQQELRIRHAAVVEASQELIYTLDEQLIIQSWNRGAAMLTGIEPAQAIGRNEREFWPADRHGELTDLVQRVQQSEAAASIDTVRERADGSLADLLYTLTPLKDRRGRIWGYSIVAHDITERKVSEQRLRFLSAEVDHRSKNLLAWVQAMASLSARGASGLEDFLHSFRSRIQTMSAAHGLLSKSNWAGTGVRDVIKAALAGLADDDRIRLKGPQAVLKPHTAQDLALSLHELATNATKYGSLSVPEGYVELCWRSEGGQLAIQWHERNGPPVGRPERQGLGSRIIQDMAGQHAEVQYRFDPDGVVCRFELAADSLVN